jgi:myo-inositol-1(or 4)-monophosphatase
VIKAPASRCSSGEKSNTFLAAAIDAVIAAGEIQLARLGTGFRVDPKGQRDIVTEVDLEVERMLRAMLAQRFPDHGVLAEEMAETHPVGVASHRWLFDPIDGTVNYAHGLPFFCASLALEVDGEIAVAAVYDPSRQELFTAERNGGAWLNAQPLHVSTVDRLEDAVLGTGFPHGAGVRVHAMENLLSEYAVRARAIRRLGSAALDLCYVACGRMDGFWDRNLKPWDTAAGALLVREAGGTTTALDGGPFSHESGNALASNGRVHDEMLRVMRAAQIT